MCTNNSLFSMVEMGQAGSSFIVLLIDSSFPIRCKCGKSDFSLPKNPYECYCCHDIEECQTALEDEVVRDEVGAILSCITLHPGFKECCLSKWSLRLTGTRYKTKQKKYSLLATDEGQVYNFEFSTLIYNHAFKSMQHIPRNT